MPRKLTPLLEIKRLEDIKRLVILAMFSDDDLMERLVLKGGNALDIIYRAAFRGSIDLDFSIEDDFKEEELNSIKIKIEEALTKTFKGEGYKVFDVTFEQKPRTVTPEMADFWGGYEVGFKIIELEKFNKYEHDQENLRRNATVVGTNQKRKFTIDISKFEYCEGKEARELDGYTIFVYTPEMMVIEKLRAICQQMPEYAKSVKTSTGTARARDFFDIHAIMKKFKIDLNQDSNIQLFEQIFQAKRVPLRLLGKIKNHKEYHRPDFDSVRATAKPGTVVEDFDYYFDFVVKKCEELKALWEE